MSDRKLERVHKVIAKSGLMSRRKAEEAILAGRVSINGEVLTELGRSVDPSVDRVMVDGQLLEFRAASRTFIFYKPRGVITSKGDPQGRPTVMDYFKDDPTLNPVGRLDFESEGLLLLTHDGELALKLTHPRYGIKKVYEVEIGGEIPTHFFSEVLESVKLEDGAGKFEAISEISPTEIEVLPNAAVGGFISSTQGSSSRHFRVTVSEGRNRFIRRMFGHYGLEVKRLKRVQLGEYELGTLKPGERKEL